MVESQSICEQTRVFEHFPQLETLEPFDGKSRIQFFKKVGSTREMFTLGAEIHHLDSKRLLTVGAWKKSKHLNPAAYAQMMIATENVATLSVRVVPFLDLHESFWDLESIDENSFIDAFLVAEKYRHHNFGQTFLAFCQIILEKIGVDTLEVSGDSTLKGRSFQKDKKLPLISQFKEKMQGGNPIIVPPPFLSFYSKYSVEKSDCPRYSKYAETVISTHLSSFQIALLNNALQ